MWGVNSGTLLQKNMPQMGSILSDLIGSEAVYES